MENQLEFGLNYVFFFLHENVPMRILQYQNLVRVTYLNLIGNCWWERSTRCGLRENTSAILNDSVLSLVEKQK